MGFGSMRVTADPDRDKALEVIRRAVELGVNHIDTAAFYTSPGGTLGDGPAVGDGPARWATELIRDALPPYDDSVTITTKVGPGVDVRGPGTGFGHGETPGELRRQVEENLDRLGRDRVDVVNLRILKKPEHDSVAARFEALAAMREEGLISHLGLSNVRRDHVEEATAIAPVVCVQNSYSIDHNRADDDLVGYCRERGIAYVPFFAIAGSRREAGASEHQDASIVAVAREHGVTPHQVRLAWTLHRGPHVLAIPGTGSVEHLEANVAAAAIRLSEDDLARLG
jgi:aryl-alcohol dehydrogenase-like predicted oxidoreductase